MKFSHAQIVGENVPASQYRSQDHKRGEPEYVMSRGELMDFALNPHKWLCGVPEDSTDSTEWGDLIDTLILGTNQFSTLYAVAPETYPSVGMKCPRCGSVTKAKSCKECGVPRVEETVQKPWDWNATYCAEWREKHTGKRIIKADMRQRAADAVEVLAMNETAMSLIECSAKQVMVTAEYHDPDTGLVIPIKTLMDLVPAKEHKRWGKTLADLKTSVSCNPPLLEKSIYDYHYDAQAALYQDVYIAATGEDRPDWILVAQENKAPYESANPLPLMSSEFLEIGCSKIAFALKFYTRCLSEGKFPSYSTGQREVVDGAYICEPRDWMILAAVERPVLAPVEKQADNEIEDYRH